MNIRVQKIASVAYRLGFSKEVEVTDRIEAATGNTLVVRALREKRVYRELELANGRMANIYRGDVILGALGKRRALRGFAGDVPGALKVGDKVQILNRGGVLGISFSDHKDLGQPLSCEVLGMPVRDGRVVKLSDARLNPVASLKDLRVPPVVLVSGTCMDSGKTLFLSEVIKEFSRKGITTAGGKLTGIACLRDLVALEDHGAKATASFLDAGYPSTVGLEPAEAASMAKTVIAHLAGLETDAIFLEMGDGVIGEYGVLDIVRDQEIRRCVRFHAFCAGDLVGAWGGHRFLSEQGIAVDLYSGPVTDNEVGVEYLQRALGKPAINAHSEPERLARVILDALGLEPRAAADPRGHVEAKERPQARGGSASSR